MLKIAAFVTVLLFLVILPTTVLAQNTPDIPEKNGDYPDPQNPKLRVRVFVHEPKTKHKDLDTATTSACIDPDSSAVVSAAGWKLPAGNWTYNLNPYSNIPSSVGSSNFATATRRGFDSWQGAQNKALFVRGSNTFATKSSYDGRNIISFGNTSRSTLGVTYIRYYVSSGIAVDVDTILNKRVPWSWTDTATSLSCGNPNSYDVQNILTHEQGHWLGLDDEYDSAYVYNTMFGYGSRNEIIKDTLSSGDKLGVGAIYP